MSSKLLNLNHIEMDRIFATIISVTAKKRTTSMSAYSSDQQTDYLYEKLKDIEVRTEQMRLESERLRQIKDEAKMNVARQFPHLFPRHRQQEGFDEISASSSTSSSLSSGGMTKSEGDAEVHGARGRTGAV